MTSPLKRAIDVKRQGVRDVFALNLTFRHCYPDVEGNIKNFTCRFCMIMLSAEGFLLSNENVSDLLEGTVVILIRVI